MNFDEREACADRRRCATLNLGADGLRRVRTAGFEGAVRDGRPGDGGTCRLPRSGVGADRGEAPGADGRARNAERPDHRRGRHRVRVPGPQADRDARRCGNVPGAATHLQRRFIFPDAATAPEPRDRRHAVDADPGRGAHLLRPRGCRRRLDGHDAHGLRLLLSTRAVLARSLSSQRRADPPRLKTSGVRFGGRLQAVFLALAKLAQLVQRALNRWRPPFGAGLDRRDRLAQHANVVDDAVAHGLVHLAE